MIINNCLCGCGTKTNKDYVRGHNLRINPKPENLKGFIKGKKGSQHPRYKGGFVDNDGYSNTFLPSHPFSKKSGHILTHRLIMEQQIGRYLTEDEIVHHKDGDKSNNDISNLQIMTKSKHAEHHYTERAKDENGNFVTAKIPRDGRREKGR